MPWAYSHTQNFIITIRIFEVKEQDAPRLASDFIRINLDTVNVILLTDDIPHLNH